MIPSSMVNLLQYIQVVSLHRLHTKCRTDHVSPLAIGTGTGDWADAYKKAAAMVSQMTLQEQVIAVHTSIKHSISLFLDHSHCRNH